jgi:glycerophosphoryl diester phosphodiesterase
LQITGDGEAVVFHDETLDRVTGTGVRHGAQHCRTEARAVPGPATTVFKRWLVLEQVMKSAIGHRAQIPLGWRRCAGGARPAVLAAHRGPHGLMSFDPDLVEALRRRSATARGIAADRADDPYYDFLPPERLLELRNFSHLVRTEPHFISFDYRQLPFAPVTEFRQAGNPVITWTIKSPEAAAQARRHCDQITFEGFLA